MKIELKLINNEVQFLDMVGKETEFLERKILIYDWDNNHKDCGIIISNLSGVQVGVERVSLGLGLDIFTQKMAGFGFEIEIVEGLSFSIETTTKAKGLVQASFNKLIKSESDNYTVDNLFEQTFLTQEELQQLLSKKIVELPLAEIV
ncbi:MAG: hypothetical protein ACRC6B_06105 [Fusobacteriaceae bacterium]